MPAPRKFDHEAAFVWWYSQPFRPGLDQVARQFSVAHQSVREIASREDWTGRAEYLDAQVREETNKRLAKTAATRTAEMMVIFDQVLARFWKRMTIPTGDPGAIDPEGVSIREALEVGKFLQLLQGSATTRVGKEREQSLEELEREMEELWLYELERQAVETDVEKRRGEETDQ